MSAAVTLLNIVFGGVGLATAGIGGYLLVRKRRFVAGAERLRGTVVAHEARVYESTDDYTRTVNETYYHPIVEVTDAGGARRRVVSATGIFRKPYADGAAVTVLLDPKNPDEAEIASFETLWLVPAILIGTGATFLAMTFWLVLLK